MEVQDTTQQRESYQAIFDAADTDGDGFLNPLDVYVSLTEFGFRHSDSLVNRVVDIYGKKCDDKFDFYTWLQVLVDLGAALVCSWTLTCRTWQSSVVWVSCRMLHMFLREPFSGAGAVPIWKPSTGQAKLAYGR
eukprot:TRINITY_DN471_c0_g1_i10.p1 TRINITY_DN471_c0_g1~~TRINITY_DN471_c0_g1_i10.p1  ORF type:complete len:134 (+),score=9.24 TRINITY_DN471_c0_g1_i10:1085-1486(+)